MGWNTTDVTDRADESRSGRSLHRRLPAPASRGSARRFPRWKERVSTSALLTATVLLAATVGLSAPVWANPYAVVINELHYNPFGPDDAREEFIEVWNSGERNVEIGGWRLLEGVEYRFPDETLLRAGEYIIVARDVVAWRARLDGVRVFGPYSRALDNDGEIVQLVDPRGREIGRVHYRDGASWPEEADGLGPTLELLEPRLDYDRSQCWAPSRFFGGTPGQPNSRLRSEFPFRGADQPVSLLVNEVRPGNDGYIEIFNAGRDAVETDGLRVLNLEGQFARLPSRRVIGEGHWLVDAETLGFAPTNQPTLYVLLGSDGRQWFDALATAAIPEGQSFGRDVLNCVPSGRDPWPCAGGRADGFVVTPTPGGFNRFRPDRRVVIHEVLFATRFEGPSEECPRDCADAAQWIELHNRSDEEVDLHRWRLTNGVTFTFPNGARIPPRDYVVVAANLERFRSTHPAVTNVFGDWDGSLGRRADTIHLRDASGNIVDRVRYGNGKPYNDLNPENGNDDGNFVSSPWPANISDSGRSIELVHAELENQSGWSWGRGNVGGSPGASNSRADATPDPVVWGLEHRPAVPTSSERVVVTCRLSAIGESPRLELRWRLESGSTGELELRDGGSQFDRLAGDGIYTAAIPAQADGEVVEFEVVAVAGDNSETRYPRRPRQGPEPFYLYEVDDAPEPSGRFANYRIVMRAGERQRLAGRDIFDDTLLPATFIGDGEVYHNVGVRFRGENSRRLGNKSFRVKFRPDDRFFGFEALNMNASNGGSGRDEYMSATVFRRSGLPSMQEWPVRLYFRGYLDGDGVSTSYVRKENYDRDFLSRYFAGRSDFGNLYRALDPQNGTGSGNLSYRGEDPASYAQVYEKRSNRDENDFSDLIELSRAFTETTDGEFVSEMHRLVDVEQWAGFFAAQALITNNDGGIHSNNGEDYYMYHVPSASPRPDAGKWLILPWDIEETFYNPGEELFRPDVRSVERFLETPEFATRYLDRLDAYLESSFAPEVMREATEYLEDADPTLADQEASFFSGFASERAEYVSQRLQRSIQVFVANDDENAENVVAAGAVWRFARGTAEPTAIPLEWTTPEFDDATWGSGRAGFGYGDGDDQTVLDDMSNAYISVYLRHAFEISDPDTVDALRLRVDYDDAFVAYLNGAEIARSANLGGVGSVGEPLPFNLDLGNAADHEAAGGDNGANPPDVFSLRGWRELLRDDRPNILAVQGFNGSIDSSDFSLHPELLLTRTTETQAVGFGSFVYTNGAELQLAGRAPPSVRSVLVNGTGAQITGLPPQVSNPFAVTWRIAVQLAPGDNTLRVEGYSGEDGGGVLIDALDVTAQRGEKPLTRAGGAIIDAQRWSRNDGPVLVGSGIQVLSGGELVVEAGTTIFVEPPASFIVRAGGNLRLEGTAENPIRIRPNSAGDDWGSFIFEDTGTGAESPVHVLRHVDTELGGAVDARNARVELDSCRIVSAGGVAVRSSDGAEVNLQSCVLTDGVSAIRSEASVVRAVGCTFERMSSLSATVFVSRDGAARSRIEGCLFRDVGADAITVRSATVDVVGNRFTGVERNSVQFQRAGEIGASLLSGNTVSGSSTGVRVTVDAALDGDHNTVFGCGKGWVISGESSVTMHSCIVWGNEDGIDASEASVTAFTFSDVQGEAIWPGEGNILADPLFVDAAVGDLALRSTSPCRGNGRDGTDMGASGSGVGASFQRGDLNSDSTVNLTDGVVLLNFLFVNGPRPSCEDAGDLNDDGNLNLTDALVLLNYLFLNGPPPAPPFEEPGLDPTDDGLGC